MTAASCIFPGGNAMKSTKAGMKIHPTDIDSVVERFENTVDVCTFPYQDALQGQDVGIAVVLDPNDAATRRALYEWTLQHLGKHQIPQRWYVIDEIPRSSRGKVNRATLAESCAHLTPSNVRQPDRPIARRRVSVGNQMQRRALRPD